ncbi:hypothetical protein D3Z53_07385 [Lachnospiraceae bacterium]|jgi:glucosamine--fructose-6-phosphate aminotransferase (isomerizing)|nr:hypothetical protein [uncultured Schaedlerella sp.]EOS39943.1 hypothetical protein C808_00914 [Lachnospiraceae bacterium M18-1]MCI9152214.1 hypothetical protein [Ruminococcus sp.]NBI57900.1 hypothetical protein [Lachnospiraceae bacterium]
MCGILGWMTTARSNISEEKYKKGIKRLFLLSETRGKEASGVCCVTDKSVEVLKTPCRAKKMVTSKEYHKCIDRTVRSPGRLVMGHARMVTNGTEANMENNQPVVRDDFICIHNGIIVNDEKLWEENPEIKRKSEVDTEIFLALLDKYDAKADFLKAFRRTLDEIEGSLSIALIDKKSDWLMLYTNTGSLYYAVNRSQKDIIFSSERYILEQMIRKEVEGHSSLEYKVFPVKPGQGLVVNLLNGKIHKFSREYDSFELSKGCMDRKFKLKNLLDVDSSLKKISPLQIVYNQHELVSMLQADMEKIHKLRRCTRCLLPETFPGISFDERGVCSICRDYKKNLPKGKKRFLSELSKQHTVNSRYDCIVPISGGRDSCYILHYLVRELHLNPVAYTYDWGLVTDLARRNIQRMCSSLGVEHILISADIRKKRENVKKNVEAWLKRPTLGTIPLFMAGDKQFFYYAQLLKRQMKVDNVIFGMNRLEETQFKARFIMQGQKEDGKDLYFNFTGKKKVRLFAGYAKEIINNPSYMNASLIDSFTGFLSYYALPQRYVRFFDYISWNQKTIESILIKEYNWETAKDTDETWRIGDGTAPFYNYIYYRLAGFTEFDTFRSNQIREGMVTRQEALSSLDEANKVSVDGFLWYCRTIGLDPVATVRKINLQTPLYE